MRQSAPHLRQVIDNCSSSLKRHVMAWVQVRAITSGRRSDRRQEINRRESAGPAWRKRDITWAWYEIDTNSGQDRQVVEENGRSIAS